MAGEIHEVGGVPHKEARGRRAQKRRHRTDDYAGKINKGIYYAIRALLDEYGFGDDAWWHLARQTDTPFRKEGRAIILPGTWDQVTITPLPRQAILLTDILFYFPEPIGRQNVTVTLRHKTTPRMLTDRESEEYSEGEPATIYDSMLHFRFLTVDTEPLSFRMTNAHLIANAIVDFDLRGRIIGGIYRKVRR